MAEPKFSLTMRKGEDTQTMDLTASAGTTFEISAASATALGVAVEQRGEALVLKVNGDLKMRVLGDRDLRGRATVEHDFMKGDTSFQGDLEFEIARNISATIQTRVGSGDTTMGGTVTIRF